jgi:ABC-type Mn2+/Zn2+ transport system ATPase subunit
LFAKKKANAKAAALEALEALEEQADLLDAPLSKKEQKELQKKQKKLEQQQEEEDALNGGAADTVAKTPDINGANGDINGANGAGINGDDNDNNNEPMSKKEKMLAKALEMEAMDAASATDSIQDDDDTPNLSKKELKALKKKEEKLAAKAAAKAEKKAQRAADLEEDTPEAELKEGVPSAVDEGDATSSSPAETTQPNKVTLEDKIRKERPPPRIRVMESAQPGYVSLRMENVGITFRNQEVLRDVTWGVQSGDRIGLVGKNGAGKTTQLRIMAGELEPTTGDVVKSSMDLRTAMLRQEFVDELVKERTLKEEFMSVFEEENQILQDLRDAETKLETMTADDAEAMQEILDRMQDLQQKADDKDVYVLESRVKKTMDLMGFNDDEQDDLVASFSGGWKMRIGLGKVLLKEPNILLLGKSLVPI